MAQLLESWKEDAERYDQDGALVKGSLLIERHIREVRQTIEAQVSELVNLRQAARICGFSPTHLGRLVKQEHLTNYGRRGAPLLKVQELPMKPGYLRGNDPRSKIGGTSKGQIVRSAVESERSHDAEEAA